ncbi:unnamed protein product, partial [marine sediment metagenome]
MIYKLEKLDRVIDKIARDLGLNDVPYADFIEWIADALQHIGAYSQYTEKESNIIIEDYEGLLPCDLYKVKRMKMSREMKQSSEGFYGGTLTGELVRLGVDIDQFTPYFRYGVLPGDGIGQPLNGSVSTPLHSNSNLITPNSIGVQGSKDYNINHDRITTAFRYGIIQIQYLAMPVDERGWPMVPDSVSYRDALFWKCTMQLS